MTPAQSPPTTAAKTLSWIAFAACSFVVACEEGKGSPDWGDLGGAVGTGEGGSGGQPTVDPASQDGVVVEPVAGATPVAGDRYRGFNLIGMFGADWPETNQGFEERSFATIAQLGFNFVRIPLDYRAYTRPSDWLGFHATAVQRLDNAVAWGQAHGVHVNLCLHRAPGYCVADWAGRIASLPPAQDLDLWQDAAAQQAFIAHWQMLANRYRQIDANHLSFNLVNEPTGVEDAVYVDLMRRTIDAIRAISPDRMIVVDGLDAARRIIEDAEFQSLDQVIQSRHCYDFPKFQFYKTSFTAGSDQWPTPHWPPELVAQYLCGGYHQSEGLAGPLVIQGNFPAGTQVAIHVNQVSLRANLVIRADDQEILRHAFVPGPNDSEASVIYQNTAYNLYQNTYDKDYAATLSADAKQLSIENTGADTDWLKFDSIALQSGGSSTVLLPTLDWGAPPATYRWENGAFTLVSYPAGSERTYDLGHYLDDWKALAASGKPVMIGEVMQSNMAPHQDALRFAEFMLGAFKQANFGWAVWDFDSTNPPGGGGFLNNVNGRTDVVTETFNGYALDRAMLEVFQAN